MCGPGGREEGAPGLCEASSRRHRGGASLELIPTHIKSRTTMEAVGAPPAGSPGDFQMALYASEMRFRYVLENDPNGVVVVSRRDRTIRFVNSSARRLLECEGRDPIGHDFGVPLTVGRSTLVE